MENLTDFDFYLKFTKPLVLNLPKIDDRVLAAAWVKKLKGDSGTDENIKLDYLKLLLFVLQRKRLAPPFTEHPNSVQKLEKFPQNQTLVDVAKKIIEGEQAEKREKFRKRRHGQSGDYPPYISDFSADLLEYVAVQDIENFGTHAYYAISKLPLQTWYRVDKQLLPKAAKSMLEVSTPPPTLTTIQSTPELAEKPPGEPPTTSEPTTEPPSEPEPPKEEPTPKKKKETKRSSLGATPPSRPIGKLSPPPEDREPPSWGSNLLEAKFLEGEVEEKLPTEESFQPPASSTMASVQTLYTQPKKPVKKPFPKARPTRASLLAQKKKQAEPPPPPPKKKKSKSKIGKPKISVPEVIEEEEPPQKPTKAIKGKKKVVKEDSDLEDFVPEADAFLDEYDAMLAQMEAEALADLQSYVEQHPDVELLPDDQLPSFDEDNMAAHLAAMEQEAMDDLQQFEREQNLPPNDLSPVKPLVKSPKTLPSAKKVGRIQPPKTLRRPPAAPPRGPTPPRRSPTPSPQRRSPTPSPQRRSPTPPRRSPTPSSPYRSPTPSWSASISPHPSEVVELSVEEVSEDVVDSYLGEIDEYDAMLDEWEAEAKKDLDDFMTENPELEMIPDDQLPSLDEDAIMADMEAEAMDDLEQFQDMSKSGIAKSSLSPLPKSHDVSVDPDASIHLSPEAREIYESMMEGAGVDGSPCPIRHPTPRLTHEDEEVPQEVVEEKGSPKVRESPLPEPATTKSSPGHTGKDPRIVGAFNEMLKKTRQLSPTVEDEHYELMERMIEEDMRRSGIDPLAKEKTVPFPPEKRRAQRKTFLDFHHKADAQLEALAEEETAEFYQTAPEDDFEEMEKLIEKQMIREGFDPHSKPPAPRPTPREFMKEKEKYFALQERIDQQLDELVEPLTPEPYEDLANLGILEEEELEKAFSPVERRLEDMKHIYHDWLTSAPALEGVPVVVPHHTIEPRRRRYDPKDFPNVTEKPDFHEYEFDIDWESWYPPPKPKEKPPSDPRFNFPLSPTPTMEEFTEIPQSPTQVLAKYSPDHFKYKYEEPEIKYDEMRPVTAVEGDEFSPKRPEQYYKQFVPPSYYDEFFKTIVPTQMGEESPPGYLASPVSPPGSPPIDLLELKKKLIFSAREDKTPTRQVPVRKDSRFSDVQASRRLSSIYPRSTQVRTYGRAPSQRIPKIVESAEPDQELLPQIDRYIHVSPEKVVPDVFDLPPIYDVGTESPPASMFGQLDYSPEAAVSPDRLRVQMEILSEKPRPGKFKKRRFQPRLPGISNVVEEQGGPEEWEQYADIKAKAGDFDFVTAEQYKQRRQRRVPGTPPLEDDEEIERFKREKRLQKRLPAVGSPVDYPPSPLSRRPAPESPGRFGPQRRTLRKRLKKRKLDFTEPQTDPDESHVEVTEVATEVVDDEGERELFMENEEVDALLAGGGLPREIELEQWFEWLYGPKGPPKSPRTPEADMIDAVAEPFEGELPDFSPVSPLRELGVIEETMAKAKAAPIYDVRRYREVHPPRTKPRILPRLVEDPVEEQGAIYDEQLEQEIETELQQYRIQEQERERAEQQEARERLTLLDEEVPAHLPSPMRPPIVQQPPAPRKRAPPVRREASPPRLPRPIRDILDTEEMPELVSPRTPDLWVPGATPPSTPYSPKITELVVDALGDEGLDTEEFPDGYQTPPRIPRQGIHFEKVTPEPRRRVRGSPEVEALFELPEYQDQPRTILRRYADWQETARTARSLEEVETRFKFPDLRYESMVDPAALGLFEAVQRRKEAERARAEAEARAKAAAERKRKAEEAAKAKAKGKGKTIKGRTSRTKFEYTQTTRERAKKEPVVTKTPARKVVQQEPPRIKAAERVVPRDKRSRPWAESRKKIAKDFETPSRSRTSIRGQPSTSRAKSAPEKASQRPSSTSVRQRPSAPEVAADRATARQQRPKPWKEPVRRPSQTSATRRPPPAVRRAPPAQPPPGLARPVDRAAARENRPRPWAQGPQRPQRGSSTSVRSQPSTQSVKSRNSVSSIRKLSSEMDRARARHNRAMKDADNYATGIESVPRPKRTRPPPEGTRGTARETRARPWAERPPKAPPREGPRPPPRGPFRKPPPPIQGPRRRKIQAVSKIDTGRRRPSQVAEYDAVALQDLGLTVRDLQEMYLDDEGMLGYEPSFEMRGPFDEATRYLDEEEGGYMIEDMASRGYEDEWEDLEAEYGYEGEVSLPEYETQLEMSEYYDEDQEEVTKTLTIARKEVSPNEDDYSGNVTVLTVEASMG